MDTSKGEDFFNDLQKVCPFGSLVKEAITNRKFFIHKYVQNFLNKKPKAQVIVLACGLDPIMLKLSETHKWASFFGVDRGPVHLQEELVQKISPGSNISFIQGRIEDHAALIQKLLEKGWNPRLPTCLVLEGIIYYVPEEAFWGTLEQIKSCMQNDLFMVGDFLIDWEKENVSPRGKLIGKHVFDLVKSSCSLSGYYSYTLDRVKEKLLDLSFSNIHFSNLKDVQYSRTGDSQPWEKGDSYIHFFHTL